MSFRRRVDDAIELRQFEPQDAAELFAAADRNRAYLRTWLPWVDLTRSATDVRQFIVRATSQYNANLGPNAGIWIDGKLAGSVGCHQIDWANRSCSIGYWLEGARQGQGIVTRCCRSLIDHLFDDLGLHRVVIQCGAGNLRSCAIPQRLGFTREGLLREAEWVNDRWVDLYIWSMLEQDWKKV